MVSYSFHFLKEGEPILVEGPLINAIEHIPEFTWQTSPAEALERITQDIMANDRFEIVAKTEEGRVVAGAVMTADDDCQVGELISVQWFYVIPEYRGKVGRKMVKLSREIAASTDFKVMAFTHRRSAGRYEINYRKLEVSKDGQESKKGH